MMLNILLFLYLAGYLVFTTLANFETSLVWCDVYYVWQSFSFGGVLAWGAFYSMGNKVVKRKVAWVYFFSWLMLGWNVAKLFLNIGVNDSRAVMVAFICIVSIVSCLTIFSRGKTANN